MQSNQAGLLRLYYSSVVSSLASKGEDSGQRVASVETRGQFVGMVQEGLLPYPLWGPGLQVSTTTLSLRGVLGHTLSQPDH